MLTFCLTALLFHILLQVELEKCPEEVSRHLWCRCIAVEKFLHAVCEKCELCRRPNTLGQSPRPPCVVLGWLAKCLPPIDRGPHTEVLVDWSSTVRAAELCQVSCSRGSPHDQRFHQKVDFRFTRVWTWQNLRQPPTTSPRQHCLINYFCCYCYYY